MQILIHLRTLANLPFFKAGSCRSPIPKTWFSWLLMFLSSSPGSLRDVWSYAYVFTFFLYNDFIYGLSQRYLGICVSMRLVCSPPFANNCLVEQEQLLSQKDIDTKREKPPTPTTTRTSHPNTQIQTQLLAELVQRALDADLESTCQIFHGGNPIAIRCRSKFGEALHASSPRQWCKFSDISPHDATILGWLIKETCKLASLMLLAFSSFHAFLNSFENIRAQWMQNQLHFIQIKVQNSSTNGNHKIFHGRAVRSLTPAVFPNVRVFGSDSSQWDMGLETSNISKKMMGRFPTARWCR